MACLVRGYVAMGRTADDRVSALRPTHEPTEAEALLAAALAAPT